MDSQNQNRIIYHTCAFCGERFPCVRIDARFCCPAHRSKFNRWRKKLPTTIDKARVQIREAAEYLDYDMSRATAVEFFNSLTSEIRAVMEARGIRFVR
jgi:predicted  nucleic acid-binding Zn-ribbon protein